MEQVNNSAHSVKELWIEAERANEILAQNLGVLKEETHELSKSLPRFTIEVEHLKKTRENLASFLGEKMKEILSKESALLSETLASAFLEKTEKALQSQQKAYEENLSLAGHHLREEIILAKSDVEKCLTDSSVQSVEITQRYSSALERAQQGTEKTFQKYLTEAEQFKREMEGTVSSLKKLMNWQKQRLTRKGLLMCGVFCGASVLTGAGLFYLFPQHVYYPDKNIARNMIMGIVTRENFGKFSSKDQDMLLEEVRKYMREAK